ncbi:MAG: M24 family metallopeptidase, partial [Nitrospirae bacterium]|nr:M24 family metallopeptidase [Nitrospirota bacterium]
MIIIKSEDEIKKIEKASKIVAETLILLGDVIVPGITTKEIERRAEEIIKKNKAIPSFKGYRGYPANLCVSVNNEVIHGIPSKKRVLKEGDIVSIDVGATYEGF